PLIMGGDACVVGSWPSAGAAAPRVKPPANVAPLFRRSRRLKRFEPMVSPSQMSLRGIASPKSRVYARLEVQSSTVRSALGPHAFSILLKGASLSRESRKPD